MVLFLSVFLGLAGLLMVISPTGFTRLAHALRVSVPAPSPVGTKMARAMGMLVLTAAVVAFIASA